MVVFPNCKINLGLHIVARRPDGYHDIETVMYPVPWCDILECTPSSSGADSLTVTGNGVACPPEKNLVMRALNALRSVTDVPATDIHLHKVIPDGAGLGGGSADAAFTLLALNNLYTLGLDPDTLAAVAATVGSDCPFFIYNTPMLATGRGTDLTPCHVSLAGLSLAIAKPSGVAVSTAQAYAGVTPHTEPHAVADVLQSAPCSWRENLVNHFESSIFAKAPQVATVKEHMYSHGAVYAAMTGSGAAVFGLFESPEAAEQAVANLADCTVFTCTLQ